MPEPAGGLPFEMWVELTAEVKAWLTFAIGERRLRSWRGRCGLDAREAIGHDLRRSREVVERDAIANEVWGGVGRSPRAASRVAGELLLTDFVPSGTGQPA